MGKLAARTLFSNDTGPLAGVGLDTLAKNQAAILELEGAQEPISCTIATGSISPTAAYVIVDTEGSAAADDLDAINPVLSASENLHTGMIVNLKAADSGRVVTVKNSSSTNGINTYDGNDYVLSTTHWLKLQLRADGKWYEVEGRAMETALAAATAAAAASTPATTTTLGIGRVATSADLVDGATITNGPAFLAAGQDVARAAANFWVGARYAECSTSAATAAKAADLANFQLVKGSRVFVTFTNNNTVADALTLNVNGTGEKTVYNEHGATSSSNIATWLTGVPIEFVYDGTYWRYKTVDAVGNAIGVYLYARDEKASAVNGGACAGGTWATRDLNKLVANFIPGASLTSNRIALPAGRYKVDATIPAFAVDTCRAALYNATSGEYILYSHSDICPFSYSAYSHMRINGEFTLANASSLEVRMWGQTTYANGMGAASGVNGVPEIYTEVEVWKM